MAISSFVLLLSNLAYWIIEVGVRLKAEDQTGDIKDLDFLSYLRLWNRKLRGTIEIPGPSQDFFKARTTFQLYERYPGCKEGRVFVFSHFIFSKKQEFYL